MKMKTAMKSLGLVIALGVVAVPVYAAMETIAEAPGKTLADFQREYSGTKPVVAWQKYHEYQMLQKAPRPSLEPSELRAEVPAAPREMTAADYARGTKPVIGFLKYQEAKTRGELMTDAQPKGVIRIGPDSVSGTKPVVAFLRSRGK